MNNTQSISFENAHVRVEQLAGKISVLKSDSKKEYFIDGKKVQEVFFASKKRLVILVGQKSFELHSEEDLELTASMESVEDYYFDECSESFFRRVKDGDWVDMQGYKIPSNFVLKGDVLISLNEKRSMKSMSFSNASFYTDSQSCFAQVNKLVFNRKLQRVKINESKVLSIGAESIHLGEEEYQQVYTGLEDSYFIGKNSNQVLMLGDLYIKKISSFLSYKSHEILSLKTNKEDISVDAKTGDVLTIDGAYLVLSNNLTIELNGQQHVHATCKGQQFIYNLELNEILTVATSTDEVCTSIDSSLHRLGEYSFYKLETASGQYMINKSTSEILKTKDGSFVRSIEPETRFTVNLAIAELDDGEVIVFADDFSYVLIDGERRINKIISGDLLLEVITEGKALIVDVRNGFKEVRTAYSGEDRIIARDIETHFMGNKRLMNVKVKTYGGKASRVVSLDSERLEKFTLPHDLSAFPDREVSSVFCNSVICEIDFESEIKIDGNVFYSAEFICFTGAVKKVLLSKSTGRPLHFEGYGHKMELAIGFKSDTIQNSYYIGEHRMIGVKTLDENLKVNELMFSLEIMTSEIPFLDSILPVIKRPHLLNTNAKWEYILFQLRSLKSEVEYLAIEKIPPHRILVKKGNNRISPKLVKSSSKILKTPEEVSYIMKMIFTDPGFLVEVG